MPNEALTSADVEAMLKDLAAAIRQDQIYVDSLQPECFPSSYDGNLWRSWRRDHRKFIERLLACSDMDPALLQRLTDIASSVEPSMVRHVMIEVLAEVVSDRFLCDNETASGFFRRLVDETLRRERSDARNGSARDAMSEWISSADPLKIARDPECRYPISERRGILRLVT